MKYLVRALKYYLTMAVVLVVVIYALVALKIVEGDISKLFVNGYDSIWQIALLLLAFSLVYPKMGYTSRQIHIPGEYGEIRPQVLKTMSARGYALEKENGEDMTFVFASPSKRALKLWEDRMTFTRTIDGFSVEGKTRDLVRVVSLFAGEGIE